MRTELRNTIMYGSSPTEHTGGAYKQGTKTYGTTFVHDTRLMNNHSIKHRFGFFPVFELGWEEVEGKIKFSKVISFLIVEKVIIAPSSMGFSSNLPFIYHHILEKQSTTIQADCYHILVAFCSEPRHTFYSSPTTYLTLAMSHLSYFLFACSLASSWFNLLLLVSSPYGCQQISARLYLVPFFGLLTTPLFLKCSISTGRHCSIRPSFSQHFLISALTVRHWIIRLPSFSISSTFRTDWSLLEHSDYLFPAFSHFCTK